MDQEKEIEEMAGANMSTREIHQHLKKRGWSLTRTSGGHDVYTHEKSDKNIAVPRHKNIKAPTILGIMKTAKMVNEQDETLEKKEMAETQAHFIKYAAEEILEYIKMGGQIEEWYQNKLSKVHSDMEGLHSWMEGEKRRTGMVSEDVEQIDELSKSTLGSYAKRASYDAVTRGMKYGEKMNQDGSNKKELNKLNKRESGIQKAVDRLSKESVNEGENKQMNDKDPCWKGYEMVGMKKKGGRDVPNCVPVKEQIDDTPFEPPYSDKPSTVKDKSGAIHDPMSRAKHLAKMAAKRQAERMKNKPTMKTAQDKPEMHRESVDLQESRRTEIVREAMKVAKDKKNQSNKTDKFEPDPELSTQINKTDV